MSEETRIIEINGVKLEVDLRTAVRVDRLKVGDKVKLLIKGYGDSFTVCAGMVIGFEPFEALPTIVVAYVSGDYSPDIKMLYYNAKSKDAELVPAIDEDLLLSKTEVLERIERQIAEKEGQITDLKQKQAYFLRHFDAYFEDVKED